jgi:hypothetical protein
MKKLFFLFLIIVCISSCHNSNTAVADSSTKSNTDSSAEEKPTSFFPVSSFLKGQLAALDSVPFTPLVYTTINGDTDSSWLKKSQLREFLAPFFSVTIDTTNLLNLFRETKFNDQTLNAITFTYEPSGKLPDSVQLRNWNVYIDPASGKVRSIYMVKQFTSKELSTGQSYTQDLIWTTDKSAQIITILNQPDGNSTVLKEQKIIWTDNQ